MGIVLDLPNVKYVSHNLRVSFPVGYFTLQQPLKNKKEKER